VNFRDYRSMHQMFAETVQRRPDHTALKWFPDGPEAQSLTWTEFEHQVRRAAKSLIAMGIKPGDKVNIISRTSPQWVISDLAITAIGACTVGIYASNLAADCRYIIDHSDAVWVFAEDDAQLEKLREIRAEIPDVRKVVLFNGSAPRDDDWVMPFDDFLTLGADVDDETFTRRAEMVSPQDPAGIIYTSGTTGVPKGVVLTHDNITFTAQTVLGCGEFNDEDEMFLFLPLAHVFARTCFYTAVITGVTTVFARSLETLAEDLKRARPHWFVSVPRIFEKVYAKILNGAEAKGGLAYKIFQWAVKVGREVSELKLSGKPIPGSLNFKYAVASKLVFSKIREAFGGRVRWCISGAAPLNPDIGKFFHACGILILEGVGMTENTSFSNVNRPDNYRFGWVGPPGPGIDQRIDEAGEIQYRGRNVMKEYYKMPGETAVTITPDGWLNTGDVGEIDAENFLRITGRKKEIIITSGGKNIAPAHIEGRLAASKYLNQVFVIGDRRNYLTALVTLDPDALSKFARRRKIPFTHPDDLNDHPEVIRLIEDDVARCNRTLASFESIKKVTIVPEFTIENEMLTPTMKLKKNVINRRFKTAIDALYQVG
jgi:long-chain acyl-CoA synthetase